MEVWLLKTLSMPSPNKNAPTLVPEEGGVAKLRGDADGGGVEEEERGLHERSLSCCLAMTFERRREARPITAGECGDCGDCGEQDRATVGRVLLTVPAKLSAAGLLVPVPSNKVESL